jgi:hypothetical protein
VATGILSEGDVAPATRDILRTSSGCCASSDCCSRWVIVAEATRRLAT